MANTPQHGDAGTTAVARQRAPSAPSARSLLLTILGEFVHARGGGVWTGTLVSALGALGVEEKSARQALSRTAADGVLAPERHGRKVRWTLTDSGAQLLQQGTERIYGFMRRPHGWDGHWLVLTVGVPESQRRLRHRLRTGLTWLGMGSPTPGLWVVPDSAKRDAAAAVVEELGLTSRAYAWVGESAGVGEPAKLLAAAWDLDDVEKRYLTFIDRFEGLETPTDHDAFVAQVNLIHEWRGFPFLDPDLPAELLREDWPGPRAAATFHTQRDRWHRRARAQWDRMAAQAATRN